MDYGPIALQAGANLPEMADDCLNLNVWTSGLNDGGKRPVMVWLNGGGFSTVPLLKARLMTVRTSAKKVMWLWYP